MSYSCLLVFNYVDTKSVQVKCCRLLHGSHLQKTSEKILKYLSYYFISYFYPFYIQYFTKNSWHLLDVSKSI